mmetsp:Transcript_6226/g.12952  ORF Transcript_6226/g.12952 Transcript_6226/m.12952 type:complete len:225 (+) Transcript_6226:563-1237(+)
MHPVVPATHPLAPAHYTRPLPHAPLTRWHSTVVAQRHQWHRATNQRESSEGPSRLRSCASVIRIERGDVVVGVDHSDSIGDPLLVFLIFSRQLLCLRLPACLALRRHGGPRCTSSFVRDVLIRACSDAVDSSIEGGVLLGDPIAESFGRREVGSFWRARRGIGRVDSTRRQGRLLRAEGLEGGDHLFSGQITPIERHSGPLIGGLLISLAAAGGDCMQALGLGS